MWDQILKRDKILTLTVTFFRVMCISTGADVSPAPSIEPYTMMSGRDRGDRNHICDLRGEYGLFGGSHGSYGGRQSEFDKGLR